MQENISMMKTHILLTTVCRPFGGNGEGDSVGAELFHAQVTREQGIFSYRQVIRCWGLDYIAANIEAPSVVLHYPSEREFVRELKNGRYSYVGINFVVATFHKLKRMTQLMRSHAGEAKIILGGYGTVLSYPLKTKVAHVTSGLGCPNGCDFCCTSHFFKRKYIPFVKTGKELYRLLLDMEKQAEKAGDVLSGFILIDEDFFLHEKRAREFLQCVRENRKPLSIMGFGSVRGLSQFEADEIAEMGFDIIWTAVESTGANFNKLKGKPLSELYSSLKSRGVVLLSSMIIGFPYQNRAKIMQEFRMFTELGPCLWQVLIYFAIPGTPLHRKMLQQNRFLPEYLKNPDYRTFDGFSMHFTHPYLSALELKHLQRELYRKNFEILGPSLMRVIRVWFEGYRNLKNSSNPLLSSRAQQKAEYVRKSIPALYPAMLFGPNKERRADARALLNEIRKEMGDPSMNERLLCLATIPLSFWTWLATKLNILQQPKLVRIQHPAAHGYRAESEGTELRTSYPVNSRSVGNSSPLFSCLVESENKE
jgi:hypothetical protein